MKELELQIKKAIKADLPAQVGEALTLRLTRADELEKLYADQLKKNETLQSALYDAKKELQDLTALKLQETTIRESAKDLVLAKLKFKIEVEMKDLQVKTSNEKTDLLNNALGLLMQNPQAVTSIFTSHNSIEHYNPDGSRAFQPLDSVSTLQTTNKKP